MEEGLEGRLEGRGKKEKKVLGSPREGELEAAQLAASGAFAKASQ